MDMIEALENLALAKNEMFKHYGSVDVEYDDGYTLFKCGDCGVVLVMQYGHYGMMRSDFPFIHCGKIRQW